MSDPAAKPPTILVIDDDAEIRYSLTRVLSSRRYQVTEAASGEQGIAMVKKGPWPDLVFLDVRMSGMSGSDSMSSSSISSISSFSSTGSMGRMSSSGSMSSRQ
jgi:two-component system nitrogen regulation response regulator GlnG